MLVVGRKVGQCIIINDDIRVQVVKSEDGHLRLAIEAPKHVSIIRGELLDALPAEQATQAEQAKHTITAIQAEQAKREITAKQESGQPRLPVI